MPCQCRFKRVFTLRLPADRHFGKQIDRRSIRNGFAHGQEWGSLQMDLVFCKSDVPWEWKNWEKIPSGSLDRHAGLLVRSAVHRCHKPRSGVLGQMGHDLSPGAFGVQKFLMVFVDAAVIFLQFSFQGHESGLVEIGADIRQGVIQLLLHIRDDGFVLFRLGDQKQKWLIADPTKTSPIETMDDRF